MTSRRAWLAMFLSPYTIGAIVFILGPILFSFYMSLTNWSLFGAGQFIGFKNYASLLRDPLYSGSLAITGYYVILVVPSQLILSMLLALLLNRPLRALPVFRAVFFMPFVLSLVSVGLIWSWLYSPDFGSLNQLLHLLHLPSPGWISDPKMAMPSIVITTLWRNVGYYMIIYLAALQAVPTDIYEAARVEGATDIKLFFRITLPMLSPTVFFTLIVSTIWAWQVFDLTYIMTQGGPGHATLSTGLYIYQTAFSDGNMGYASAQSWVLMLVILVLTLIYFRTQRLWVYYEN